MTTHLHIPAELRKMNAFFSKGGYSAYLVGGAVRDMLLGKQAADWDIATDASPEQVASLFHHVIPTGIAHGTVTVRFMKHNIEVTTFRTESAYSDGRHPDSVSYAKTIEEDLSRRDFTMNAVAVSLKTGKITDPFGGREDIRRRLIRTVGIAQERFSEDGLRPIRAVRFASQLNFSIDTQTLQAIPQAMPQIQKISIERFRDELIKILKTEKPSAALKILEQTGILRFFLPELTRCRGVVQADCRGFHKFDVLDHLLFSCDAASAENLPVRLSALFHDCGKPATKKTEIRTALNTETGTNQHVTIHTFFNHEKKSAHITAAALERLRFPKATEQYVAHLVEQHMFHYESSWTDAAVRRFIIRAAPDTLLRQLPQHENKFSAADAKSVINDLFDLRAADVSGMTGTPVRLQDGHWSSLMLEFIDRIDNMLAQKNVFSLKDLAVSGKDLIAEGITPGRQMGLILNNLLDNVIENPENNTKEKLLAAAKKMYGNSV